MPQKRKNAKAKIKFREYRFSLSDKEKARYDRLCAYEKIGFKRLVKKALKTYYQSVDIPESDAVNENQLDLFEPMDLFGQPLRRRKSRKRAENEKRS